MELARFLHGAPDSCTPGLVLRHGAGYDAFAAVFFGGRRRHVYTKLAELSGLTAGDQILDMGCGPGYFTRILAGAAAPGGSAVGVDASEEAVAQARKVTRLANCTFVDGVAEAIEAPDGTYDVVVTSLMMHHLPEDLRPRVVEEMFRVLRPGGRVLIADFRPPASRIGRHIVGAITGPMMRNTAVDLLEPMTRTAGFEQIVTGDVRPWMHYVQARKPAR